MLGRSIVAGFAVAALMGAPLEPQLPRPLIPLPEKGMRVVPFFDGWFANPDGTISFSFGYSNLNKDTLVEIPLGPDNFITPKEYDGRHPTSFPVMGPDIADGGGAGRGAAPAVSPATAAARVPGAGGGTVGRERDRDRGVFTVTVPAGFKGDVVWTLKYAGHKTTVHPLTGAKICASWPSFSGVPARAGSKVTPCVLRYSPIAASTSEVASVRNAVTAKKCPIGFRC